MKRGFGFKNFFRFLSGAITSSLLFIASAGFASTDGIPEATIMEPTGESGLYFSLGGYHFEGELLVFDYSVKYPGVTILGMTDKNGDEIWKGEFLNEIPGDQSIRLHSNKLVSGETYVFKFQFKRDLIMKAVTIP